MPTRLDLVEYVALRLIRRFVVSDHLLLRFGRYLPYYRQNANQTDPGPVVDTYLQGLAALGIHPGATRRILEIGSGTTNSVAYALQRTGMAGQDGEIYCLEPYAPFDARADGEHRKRELGPVPPRVRRIGDLSALPPGSIDVVVSSSVLEHVADPRALFAEIGRVLGAGGVMLHAVDYRDHFFKYPYHFLCFRRRTWERWLDPGDLPRWRLQDHLSALTAAGFTVDILHSTVLAEQYSEVAQDISREFDRDDPRTAVATATFACRRSRPPAD